MKKGTLLKVKRRVVSLLLTTLPFTMMAQGSRTVHGNVTDEQGEPLIGVTVMADGTATGHLAGIFYWEPEAPNGYNGGYRKGCFDGGKPTTALDVFKEGAE